LYFSIRNVFVLSHPILNVPFGMFLVPSHESPVSQKQL
jgi:hypothetical protein